MTPYARLSPEQVTPRLTSLFDPKMPASLRCFAVLAGDAAGEILTDDPSRPTWSVVRESGGGTVYLAGVLDAPLTAHLIANLRATGDVLIGFWSDDDRIAVLPADSEYVGAVLEFTDRVAETGRLDELHRLPAGCELRRMNQALLDRCTDRTYYASIFGSAERAIEKGVGFCLVRDDEVLSEAFAGPTALGTIEIGTATAEPHRGRGYATITCAHLIRTCEAVGMHTYWNCAKQNLASAAVARKLGFRMEREYRLVAWFRSPT